MLRQIGYADALLARRDGDRLVLVDGHLRQGLDPEQVVPVLVLDLDEREADVLLATLDPLAAMAVPEPEALRDLLGRVEVSSAAVRDLLDSLARGAGLPVLPLRRDPDHVPEAPEPVARPGDLWELGRHRLACADSTAPEALARLMGAERAQVLWTDPPYGVDYVGKTPRALRIEGDVASGLEDLLRLAFAAAATVLAPGAALYVCHPAGPQQMAFLRAFCSRLGVVGAGVDQPADRRREDSSGTSWSGIQQVRVSTEPWPKGPGSGAVGEGERLAGRVHGPVHHDRLRLRDERRRDLDGVARRDVDGVDALGVAVVHRLV